MMYCCCLCLRVQSHMPCIYRLLYYYISVLIYQYLYLVFCCCTQGIMFPLAMLAVPHLRHFYEQYLLKYKLSLAADSTFVGSGGQSQGNVQTIPLLTTQCVPLNII